MVEGKYCSRCNVFLHRAHFASNGKGLQSKCRKCFAVYMREYRARKKGSR